MSMTSIGFDIFAKDRASAVLDKVGRKADESAGFFEKHKATIAAGSAIAGAAIVKFGSDSIAAFEDADKSQRVLQDAYARFPALADVNISALQDQAAALQNKTKFDGDNINAMQGTLAQYKLTGTQIQQLTPLVLDYAEKTGKDLPTAAEAVGKAMLGQGKSLKDVGIKFKDTGTTAGNFKELMGGLRQQVGGFAEKEGKSAEGQAAILANNFGDIQEAIGQQLLPVVTMLVSWLGALVRVGSSVIGWITQNRTAVVGLTGVMLALVAVTRLHGAILAVQAAGGLAKYIASTKIAAIATRTWAAVQWLMNAALSANPIGIVIVAIAALAAGIIYAYRNSETFRRIVQGAFQAIAAIARWFWNSVMAPVIRFLINGFATVADWIGNMLDALSHIPGFGWARDAANKMHGAAGAARSLASNIRDIPENVNVSVNIRTAGLAAAAQAKNVISQLRDMRGYATGGTNIPAGLAWVGENGPELMYVPGGSTIYDARTSASMASGGGHSSGGSGGGDQTLVVQFTLDGRVVQQSLLKLKRTQGGAALGLG